MTETRFVIDEITAKDTWRIFRIMSELVEGFDTMSRIGPAVSIFGSARSKEGDRDYQMAESIAFKLAERGFAIITGGGPGIMEAGNKGAVRAGGTSVGLNIQLPHEQDANDFQTVSLDFRYFFIRKLIFIKYAMSFIMLPGGFGTFDELFEALTLIQTKKIRRFPVYLVDSEYWGPLVKWMGDVLVPRGLISAKDLKLFSVVDDADRLVEHICWCEKEKCYDFPDEDPRWSVGPNTAP